MNSAIRDLSSDKLARPLDWDGVGCERRENSVNEIMYRGIGRGIEWIGGKYNMLLGGGMKKVRRNRRATQAETWGSPKREIGIYRNVRVHTEQVTGGKYGERDLQAASDYGIQKI